MIREIRVFYQNMFCENFTLIRENESRVIKSNPVMYVGR